VREEIFGKAGGWKRGPANDEDFTNPKTPHCQSDRCSECENTKSGEAFVIGGATAELCAHEDEGVSRVGIEPGLGVKGEYPHRF